MSSWEEETEGRAEGGAQVGGNAREGFFVFRPRRRAGGKGGSFGDAEEDEESRNPGEHIVEHQKAGLADTRVYEIFMLRRRSAKGVLCQKRKQKGLARSEVARGIAGGAGRGRGEPVTTAAADTVTSEGWEERTGGIGLNVLQYITQALWKAREPRERDAKQEPR
ncbi:unnamed protein product [Calypogeia fissa]